jgi:hypothetical protein
LPDQPLIRHDLGELHSRPHLCEGTRKKIHF